MTRTETKVKKEIIPMSKDGKQFELDEVIYWGGKPLTVAEISIAVKQYTRIKEQATASTDRRRKREKEAKLLAEQQKQKS